MLLFVIQLPLWKINHYSPYSKTFRTDSQVDDPPYHPISSDYKCLQGEIMLNDQPK
jgi:hypothetical protein